MIDSVRSFPPDAALYPECPPRASGMLALDARHTMHWEECGNANGVPLLFVHGGPGARAALLVNLAKGSQINYSCRFGCVVLSAGVPVTV